MYIYLLRNSLNDKSYVGKTTARLEVRLRQHQTTARNEKRRNRQAITMAIHKYGWDSFEVSTLAICDCDSSLDSAETYWIKAMNSLSPNGYNLNAGGGSPKHSEETKQKIGNANRGRPMSDASRVALLQANLGKRHTEGARRKIGLGGIGRAVSPERRAKIGASNSGENSGHAKLTWEKVREMRNKHANGARGRDLALEYQVGEGCVSGIVNHKKWKELPTTSHIPLPPHESPT